MYSWVLSIGLITIFIGIVIVVIAMLMLFLGRSKGSVHGGGVILIGPIPIIFGNDLKAVKWLMILAIILMAIALMTILIPIFIPGK